MAEVLKFVSRQEAAAYATPLEFLPEDDRAISMALGDKLATLYDVGLLPAVVGTVALIEHDGRIVQHPVQVISTLDM